MYTLKMFGRVYRAEIWAFIEDHGFATLVTHDGRRPIATHLPVALVDREEDSMTLVGHLARANPQWRSLDNGEALLIFSGPQAYISPRWYNHLNVPTWNYQAVHVYGKARTVDDGELRSILARLVGNHEAGSSYKFETLPEGFVEEEMRGAVGFALDVTEIEASWKLSQNRDDESHANIVGELEKRGDENAREVARAMRAQRGKRPEPLR